MLKGSLIKFCIHYSYLLLIIIFIIHCHKGSITIIDASHMQKAGSFHSLKSKLKLFTNETEQEESLCKSVKYGIPLDLTPFWLHLDYLPLFSCKLSFTSSLLWVWEFSPCLAIFILQIDVQADILKTYSIRLKPGL